MMTHVARAKAEFEDASRGFKSQLAAELDAAPRNCETDGSHESVGNQLTIPRILGIGTANPPVRLTQEQSFHAAGYQDEHIWKIFLSSGIDHRDCYLEGNPNCEESSDQLNQRYLRGAMKNRLSRDSGLCEFSRNYRGGCGTSW
jgi:hypothetical protein